MQETEKIWMNGELVDWADAKVHVGVHGLHYGTGVFEGIRCYETARGPEVFRLEEHLDRLFWSAKMYRMEIPFSMEQLKAATHSSHRLHELISNILDLSSIEADRLTIDLVEFRLDDVVANLRRLVDRDAAGKGLAFVGKDIDDEKFFGIGIGVGLRKAEAGTLGKAFDAAIDALSANGEYKKLSGKYFAYDVAPKKK